MRSVLDASAIMALLLGEPGQAQVRQAIYEGSAACTVNLAEVAGRCARANLNREQVDELLSYLDAVTWIAADYDLARRAGELLPITRPFGLSLGDRFCLALT